MTKDRLRAYKDLRRECQQLHDQLEKVRAAAGLQAQRLTGMPGGASDGHAMDDTVARIAELERLYLDRIADAMVEQAEIENAITCLPPRERMLIRCRYLDGKRWEDVCCELHYSWQGVHKIHGQALKKLESK